MNKHLIRAVLGFALLALSAPGARASDPDAAVVVEWNQILQDSLPASAAILGPRYYVMMHVAMFDAVNSIERAYTPYRIRVRASHGASPEAAAAQAAHDVLVALIPAGEATFDAALAARLATIPSGRAARGVRVGQRVAEEILAWRRNDGSATTPPPYVLPPLPGLWQPTPPGFLAATFTQFPDMEPFALLTPTQYLPVRFPELTSERYAADFNAVKEIGSATSAVRTAEQTLISRLWAGVVTRTNLFAIWNNVARDTSHAHGLGLLDTARVFALMNASIHDGLLTSHTSKFVYGLWRPVTAIRRADEDLNALTVADPSWTPLLVTPPYPSHSGNMACSGASAATALALNFGTNDIPVTATWLGNTGNPDVSRNYAGFWQLADEEARSRIYGGIHFTFESLTSQESCAKVAGYVFENFMIPR